MKSQGKISMMGLMMITSQLLLSIFLGYWLYSQFAEKKKLLSEEIESGLRKSVEQVIDSMLVTNLINPLLKDTSNFSIYVMDTLGVSSMERPIGIEMSIDSLPQMLINLTGKHKDDILNHQKVTGRIEIIDSSFIHFDKDIQSTITVSTEQDTSNQLLFKGVKLLINTVGKFDMNQRNWHTIFATSPDSVLLTELFGDFIEKKYNDFTVVWQSTKKSDINILDNSGLKFNSNLFENPFTVSITGYNLYILRSISPQIIFAIILLLITALSFRMAFTNLNNQRKLMIIKNDFISNITHELKTPVSTVKVALEALLEYNLREDPKRTKEYLEMAHIEMDRLDQLVNQVLNNSSLENGNDFIFINKIDLVSLVNGVLISMQSNLNKQEAIINLVTKEDEIFVDADKLHLHGVIVNLLDNSLKYNDRKPEITVELGQNKRETQITVSDNGIGIPNEYVDKVFDKFFRVPKGDEHNIKGYGLGLNYAALVMEHHKGKISVSRNELGGCVFTVRLPNIQ